MTSPKVYLIKRTLTDEQKDVVKAALSITPLSAVVVTDPRDTVSALEYCTEARVLARPIAILAEFDSPLTAVNEDGSLTCLSI
jgi:hypothetical protein